MDYLFYITILITKFLTTLFLIIGTMFMGYSAIYFATIPDIQWLSYVCAILFCYLVFVTIWASDKILVAPVYNEYKYKAKPDVLDRLQKEFNERKKVEKKLEEFKNSNI